MLQLHRRHTTAGNPGQPWLPWPMLGLLLLSLSCHRLPPPGSGDPRLPAAFRTPEATFQTWVDAGLASDEQGLARCYWDGLGQQELRAWLAAHRQPEARTIFKGARLQTVRYRSPVEAHFVFLAGNGDEFRGVMVRTGHGWKVQSW